MAEAEPAPATSCGETAALVLLGERWNLLLLSAVMSGHHRFNDIREEVGIASNMLQARLGVLVAAGVVERRSYQDRPPRSSYWLTECGLALMPAMAALAEWGGTWLNPGASSDPSRDLLQ